MIQLDTLTLPLPPSVNRYYRHVGAKVLISADGRAYRSRVVSEVLMQLRRPPRLSGRLAIIMRVYPPDRRRRDLDNLRKALWDALTHAGVWLDDSQIDDDRAIRCERVAGGRVEIDIEEIGRAAA